MGTPKEVGGLEHVLFSIKKGIILPIDEIIFFKMVKTTNQPKEVGIPAPVNGETQVGRKIDWRVAFVKSRHQRSKLQRFSNCSYPHTKDVY